MDLGISGRSAIVCGASAGLGRATAFALAREGVSLVIAARGEDRLAITADEIRSETGVEVKVVATDVTTEEGREALLAACPAIDSNMLSAIFLIRATLDGMIDRRFGRVINITSHMVKQPAAFLGLSNGARSGLTGFIGGLSRDVAEYNVTLNNVLPGQFDTDRLRSTHGRLAQSSGRDLESVRATARSRIPARRFGEPEEFGDVCAFICSARAGYITGQNILLDGGEFPGLL